MEQGVGRIEDSEAREERRERVAGRAGGATAEAPEQERGAGAEPRASAPSERGSEKKEDAWRYCPVCSQRLESRRCKLICNVCGYYMSCADYY